MRLSTLLSLALLACSFVSSAACGSGDTGRSNVVAGTMPEGGNFTGVWFSPQYGRMDFVQTGSSVIGEYTKDERRGRIEGTTRGNLMRFQWTERRELVRGRPTTTRGLGYFVYEVNGTEHRLAGEWGIDENEIGGGPWTAVKSARMRPQLSTDTGSQRVNREQELEQRGVVRDSQPAAPAQDAAEDPDAL
jgi:hypothetical protein